MWRSGRLRRFEGCASSGNVHPAKSCSPMPGPLTKDKVSAGGIVYRKQGERIEIVLIAVVEFIVDLFT